MGSISSVALVSMSLVCRDRVLMNCVKPSSTNSIISADTDNKGGACVTTADSGLTAFGMVHMMEFEVEPLTKIEDAAPSFSNL